MFEFKPDRPGYGRVIATIGVYGPDDARSILRAVECSIRNGNSDPLLAKLRRQLLNMRWRAFVEGWSGWPL